MFTQLFIVLTLIFDIVYCAVYTPSRSASAIAFVALNMFTKVGMFFFGHRLLTGMGGSYSLQTQTTEGSSSAASVAGGGTTGATFSKDVSLPLDGGEGFQCSPHSAYSSPRGESACSLMNSTSTLHELQLFNANAATAPAENSYSYQQG
jgi:hypothetical protein